MTKILRFAPSPTGRLHVGNIRPALINWLYAKNSDGKFMLRLDDTDAARSTEEFAKGIREDLTWLGLDWDFEAKQSDRFAHYQDAVEKLKSQGRLYACYDEPDELDRRRKRNLARGLPPIYDRAGLKLTDQEKAAFEKEGRAPHWRFLLNNYDKDPFELKESKIAWEDLIRGHQEIDLGSLSDPVLIRGDGTFLYTLPSVVDDIDFKITDVIRGEDHVANTAAQIDIFQALGGALPNFGHHNLLVGADGQALSKRLGALSIQSFREEGLEPMAVVSHSATIGTSDPVKPYQKHVDVRAVFGLKKLSRAPARFDPDELKALNGKLLHEMDYFDAELRLIALDIKHGETFWAAVRGNLNLFEDVKIWRDVIWGEITPIIEDAEFATAAADLLPDGEYDENTWGAWTSKVKDATGAKGKALFKPLRLALTGQEHGPELKLLLPLIGRDKALRRLGGNKV